MKRLTCCEYFKDPMLRKGYDESYRFKSHPHVNDRRLNYIICQNPFSFIQLILFLKHLLSQASGSHMQWCWIRLNSILVSYYLLNFRWTSLEKWSMWMLSSRNYFSQMKYPQNLYFKMETIYNGIVSLQYSKPVKLKPNIWWNRVSIC